MNRVTTHCPHCQTCFSVRTELPSWKVAGKTTLCPKCKLGFSITVDGAILVQDVKPAVKLVPQVKPAAKPLVPQDNTIVVPFRHENSLVPEWTWPKWVLFYLACMSMCVINWNGFDWTQLSESYPHVVRFFMTLWWGFFITMVCWAARPHPQSETAFGVWYSSRWYGRIHPFPQALLWIFGGFMYIPAEYVLWRLERAGWISHGTANTVMLLANILLLWMAWMSHRAAKRQRQVDMMAQAIRQAQT
jgi:hypothetical protein